jgi:hypothetical protein
MENTVNVPANRYPPGLFTKKPTEFIGETVKIAFPYSGLNTELLWVAVDAVYDSGKLHGTLNNDPANVKYLKNGDEISCWPSEVLAIMGDNN